MKKLLFLCFATLCFVACNQTPAETTASENTVTEAPTDSGGSQDDPDLVAITDVVHGFYKWYYANNTTALNINFLKPGKSTTLDPAKLDAYFAALLKSGYISQAFVDAERAYLKNLEATVWKNENMEVQPLTGLDYDRFFCAQDWDINFWTTAPVEAEGLGTDQVKATISGTEGGSPRQQKLELKKENGKWLITSINCDDSGEN